jgi:uracil-DNA glycosylase family 4
MTTTLENHAEASSEASASFTEPFGYDWMSPYINRVMDLSAQFTDYLPVETLSSWVTEYWNRTAAMLPEFANETWRWDVGLRAYVLSKLPKLINACTRCELAENRIPLRGSCIGEGTVNAKLMVVAEAAGAFEARTGIPLTGSRELRASTCATKCQHYWDCFRPQGGRYVRTPTRPCTYQPVEISPEEMRNRTAATSDSLMTAGEHLDKALMQAKYVRRSYVKLLTMQQELGMQNPDIKLRADIYLTNATKCRSMVIDEYGKEKNVQPKKNQIDACRPWLQIQKALIQPQKILAIGSPATVALESTRKVAMEKECGPDAGNTPMIDLASGGSAYVTLHPAYWMRKDPEEQPAYQGKLAQDLMKIHQD